MKIYKLPKCNHTLCSQCLVCHFIADGSAKFKITYTKDYGDQVTVHTNSVSKNSVFRYVTCPFCRGSAILANVDLQEAQKETDTFHMREKLIFFKTKEDALLDERNELRDPNIKLRDRNDDLLEQLSDILYNRPS